MIFRFMKLIINKNQIDSSPEQFLRRVGYGYIRDRQRDKESFVRRLGSGFYPRLHMYASKRGNSIVFDLHLDQKQASYAGSHMHNAEYDGEVVEAEIRRIKSLLGQGTGSKEPSNTAGRQGAEEDKDLLDKIGHGELPKEVGKPEKKSWWKKLF